MNRPHQQISLCACLCLAWLGILLAGGFAAETDCRLDPRQRVQVTVPGQAAMYYQLLRSPDVSTPGTVVSMKLGTDADVTLFDCVPVLKRAFFRVRAVPTSSPLDTDGDGTDDVLELLDPTGKNPLNPSRSINFTSGAIIAPCAPLTMPCRIGTIFPERRASVK